MLIAALLLASIAAFGVSAIAGGGAGLVLVPLLRLVVPIANVPAALSLGTAASAASRLALMRTAVRGDIVRRFVPLALPSAALGAWLLTKFPTVYVELLIALFLMSNLPTLFRGPPPPRPPLSRRWLPAIGAAAGLLSGFTGAVGLLFNDVYRRLGLRPEEIVATRAANEILLHILKLTIYLALGLLPAPALLAGAVVAVGAVIASATAARWLRRMKPAAFRLAGKLAMVAAGVAMLSVSGSEVARIHRAWIEIAAVGPERELRLIVKGSRTLAIEVEATGSVAVERPVPYDSLPAALRTHIERKVRRTSISLVEKVETTKGSYYEIYYSDGVRERKFEAVDEAM